MKNQRRTTGIFLAVLLASAGTAALVAYVQSAKDKAVASDALDVYVVDKLVPKGAEAATIKLGLARAGPDPAQAAGCHEHLDEASAPTWPPPTSSPVTSCSRRAWRQRTGRPRGHGQGADRALLDSRAGRRRDCRRATSSASTSRSIRSIWTSGRPGRPTRRQRRPPPRRGTTASSDHAKKTPNMTRLEFQHVLVTNVQTTRPPARDRRDRRRPA